MELKQFVDTGLAHHAYVVISEGQAAVIDPARDPQPYYDFAKARGAQIVAVIETHPHADFVSSHREIAEATGATIYVSKLVGADYPHQGFDDGDALTLGKVTLAAMNTPGHSPDSISVLLKDEQGQDHALFSGDTLFVGDVGRPDLRETVGNMTAQREALARMMYHTTREKLLPLADEVLVYPAHGAGSLCGKALGADPFTTIGREKQHNRAMSADISEEAFVSELLADQPFIPKYFTHDVGLNKEGAPGYAEAIAAVPRLAADAKLETGVLVVDARPEHAFKQGHLAGAINLQDGGKFETWLGSIVGPDERFYLIAPDEATRESLIGKAAKIGYEGNMAGVLLPPPNLPASSQYLDEAAFRANPAAFTVLDVRNYGEVASGRFFAQAVNIPLPELRERLSELPTDKPIVVHCAAGYRSAAGHSIVEAGLADAQAYDLSTAINDYK